MKSYQLAIVASHPTQYHAPLFRKLAATREISPTVYYLSDISVRGYYDRDFHVQVKWDIPLLDGYSHTFLHPIWNKEKLSNWNLHPTMASELLRHKYDAVLLHGYMAITNWLALLGAWVGRIPVIFRGETDLLLPRSPWKERVKQLMLTPLFKGIDAFLYSYAANATYFKYYGVPASKLFFCPCAVDNDFWRTEQAKLNGNDRRGREELGIPFEAPVILFAAKLMPLKRPFDLLEAYREVFAATGAWLLFVGDGELRPALERYVAKHDLSRVRLLGFKNQSELPRYYAMSDIFVLCSDHDKSPKALNEAMNFGLPAIVTDKVGTAEDLIQQGENGYVYPLGNVPALREHLATLLENLARTREMGNRSREIVAEWSYDKDVEGILSALRYVSSPAGSAR